MRRELMLVLLLGVLWLLFCAWSGLQWGTLGLVVLVAGSGAWAKWADRNP